MHSRRTVLKTTLAAAIAAPVISVADDRTLRVKITEADGSPLAKERLKNLIARDMEGDPLPLTIKDSTIELPKEPIELAVTLKVPDFGEVYCIADNEGKGYSQGGEIDFVLEAAKTRTKRVMKRAKNANTSDAFNKHFAADRAAKTVYESLSHMLHAGEQLVLDIARDRISKLAKPRTEFLFSILPTHAPEGGVYAERVKQAFNFAPTSWYWWEAEEPPAARINYARMDQTVDWLVHNGLQAKIFGYCYMTPGATPKWIQPEGKSPPPPDADAGDQADNKFNPRWHYDRIKAEYLRVIKQTVTRYKGRASYVEVINEAHDKANIWGLNHDQIVEMTRLCCQAAGGAGIKRLINNCCLWAEYAKRPNANGSRRWSPYRYLSDCIKAGTEFEVVGLQLYYPQYDLFEIDRVLERFTSLGKPLHITEMSTASKPGLDPHSMRPHTSAPGWHGEWSEATQADWTEAIYTMVYSKPQFECVGWWDFTDQPGHFWPFGGLLREDLSPKPAFERILKLQKDWGVAK